VAYRRKKRDLLSTKRGPRRNMKGPIIMTKEGFTIAKKSHKRRFSNRMNRRKKGQERGYWGKGESKQLPSRHWKRGRPKASWRKILRAGESLLKQACVLKQKLQLKAFREKPSIPKGRRIPKVRGTRIQAQTEKLGSRN